MFWSWSSLRLPREVETSRCDELMACWTSLTSAFYPNRPDIFYRVSASSALSTLVVTRVSTTCACFSNSFFTSEISAAISVLVVPTSYLMYRAVSSMSPLRSSARFLKVSRPRWTSVSTFCAFDSIDLIRSKIMSSSCRFSAFYSVLCPWIVSLISAFWIVISSLTWTVSAFLLIIWIILSISLESAFLATFEIMVFLCYSFSALSVAMPCYPSSSVSFILFSRPFLTSMT